MAKKKEIKKAKKKSENLKKKSNLWEKFRIFCHGVKSETSRVHWPSKKDMLKYSVATVIFIIYFSVFFYLIDIIFAFIKSLFS